jgi:hypothetical protein
MQVNFSLHMVYNLKVGTMRTSEVQKINKVWKLGVNVYTLEDIQVLLGYYEYIINEN